MIATSVSAAPSRPRSTRSRPGTRSRLRRRTARAATSGLTAASPSARSVSRASTGAATLERLRITARRSVARTYAASSGSNSRITRGRPGRKRRVVSAMSTFRASSSDAITSPVASSSAPAVQAAGSSLSRPTTAPVARSFSSIAPASRLVPAIRTRAVLKVPASPVVVDVLLDPLLVDGEHGRHRLVRQRGQIARVAVVVHLLRPLGARNHAGDRLVHQDPAQRERRHLGLLGDQLAKLLDGLQPDLEGNARKRLALVPLLAVAVVAAVVVGGEAARARHLSRQHPRRQRQARQHADLAPPRLGEEQVARPLAEDVVND